MVTVSKRIYIFFYFAALTTEEGGMDPKFKTVPLMQISDCMRRPSGPLK